ncbi:MAG TPA: SusD/RagB family nutrient-binding outer membrane lipoprotein [Ohtaekwangia sp.]|uniref:SusD/RagB family nutrient-binding outer membrane lipoprotein n=1 Tax=Ohtaekwangia sp. TaxID=2066019 RepID=UPI002F935475
MRYTYYILIFIGLAVLGTACNDYLDVNTNPNSATSAAPELILSQALTATAYTLNGFNTYGSQIGGYAANAGGYGGFNELVTYNYTSGNYSGLWTSVYDNLEDYQYIIDNSEDEEHYYFKGVASIMEAHGFQLLVDAYNNIPYSDALKGANSLSPAFDDAASVYAGLAAQLDDAISTINKGLALEATGGVKKLGSYDVLFAGDMTKWKQLANTLKLRLVVRGNGKVTFSSTSFSSDGFLTTDALINPGFARDNNKQNPAWSTWAYSYTGAAATKSWIPSTFIMAFYDGTKLLDTLRGAAIYYQFPKTGTNQLGFEGSAVPSCPTGSFWYPSTERTGTAAGNTTGTLKGPNAGYPLLTAAESYFLQAEAVVRNIVSSSSTAKTLFTDGITASFNYIYMLPDKSISGSPSSDATKYLNANSSSYLVNFDQATTTEHQIEAIITQKYIALNFIHSHEGWNEYRRTGYPAVSGTGATTTFASTTSQSTRADRLPSRILYPSTEVAYNGANVPQGISPFTSLIFWAK